MPFTATSIFSPDSRAGDTILRLALDNCEDAINAQLKWARFRLLSPSTGLGSVRDNWFTIGCAPMRLGSGPSGRRKEGAMNTVVRADIARHTYRPVAHPIVRIHLLGSMRATSYL